MKNKETVLTVVQEQRDLLKELIKRLPGVVAPEKTVCSKDGRFTRNADGTVTDTQLKLIWYPTLENKFTWEEAKKECAKLGCSLPTRRELESLVDITKYNPAIDKEIFPDTKINDYYWTSDVYAGDSGGAWRVGVSGGGVGYCSKGYGSYVRPVRSSQ